MTYTCDFTLLPDGPGVYIFGRRFGTKAFEALYIGKASTSVLGRVRAQFNNRRLMNHVKGAAIGKRVLLVGCFRPGPRQKPAKCLPIIERALIRHFLERDDDLVNIMGTRLKTHEIKSGGALGYRIPKIIVVNR